MRFALQALTVQSVGNGTQFESASIRTANKNFVYIAFANFHASITSLQSSYTMARSTHMRTTRVPITLHHRDVSERRRVQARHHRPYVRLDVAVVVQRVLLQHGVVLLDKLRQRLCQLRLRQHTLSSSKLTKTRLVTLARDVLR